MYTLMKSEQARSTDGSNKPRDYKQREVARYLIFGDALSACVNANREAESRHYLMNASGMEYYASNWID
jgi:hypothetical protein